MLGLLCRWIPALRFLWVGIGYVLLIIGGVIWFVCFPMTAYTMYYFRQFPFEHYGISLSLPFPLEFFLPADLQPLLGGICLAFVPLGLFTIYFNVRKLRRLRLGEN